MPDTGTLKGLRREMTREMFEELAALQCEVPEILGYVGTTAEKLEKWCRKTYRHQADSAIRAFTAMMNSSGDTVRELFE